MSLQGRWQSQLDTLKQSGRFRRLTLPVGIDFSSNDYLGYARTHWPQVECSRSGGASRLLRGHHAVWDEVESQLALWHAAEAALVMNSGYTANEGLLSTIIGPDDFVLSDQLNHASLIDGMRLSKAERSVYRHFDLEHVEQTLRQVSARRQAQQELFIITESLFGMDGDVAPLAELADLAERFEAHLIVDEAHATGCFGSEGSGLVDTLGLRERALATMHTGGKALGVPGAYLVGSRLLKEFLVNRCRHLIYTTALPPIVGHWWLEALGTVRRDDEGRRNLRAVSRRFRETLAGAGVSVLGEHYVAPIVLGTDELAVSVAQELQAAGYDIRAIRPPTVAEGTARLRVSLHADHPVATIDAVTAAIVDVTRRFRASVVSA